VALIWRESSLAAATAHSDMLLAIDDATVKAIYNAFEDGYRAGQKALASKIEMPRDEKARRAQRFGIYAAYWWHGFDKARWDHYFKAPTE
jgi:hypothetical protein